MSTPSPAEQISQSVKSKMRLFNVPKFNTLSPITVVNERGSRVVYPVRYAIGSCGHAPSIPTLMADSAGKTIEKLITEGKQIHGFKEQVTCRQSDQILSMYLWIEV